MLQMFETNKWRFVEIYCLWCHMSEIDPMSSVRQEGDKLWQTALHRTIWKYRILRKRALWYACYFLDNKKERKVCKVSRRVISSCHKVVINHDGLLIVVKILRAHHSQKSSCIYLNSPKLSRFIPYSFIWSKHTKMSTSNLNAIQHGADLRVSAIFHISRK